MDSQQVLGIALSSGAFFATLPFAVRHRERNPDSKLWIYSLMFVVALWATAVIGLVTAY